jgi:hypothetical protein
VALVRLAVALFLLAGCGGAAHARGAPSPGRWLSANTAARQVTLTLVAGYNGTYGGFNFDGYGRGALLFRVPAGWRITVLCRIGAQLRAPRGSHGLTRLRRHMTVKVTAAPSSSTSRLLKGKRAIVSLDNEQSCSSVIRQ